MSPTVADAFDDFEDFDEPEEAVPDDDGGGMVPTQDLDELAARDVQREELNARLEDTYKRDQFADTENEWPLRAITPIDGYMAAYVRQRKKLPIAACPTPFPYVNQRCFGQGGRRGFAKGWHTVIAGASGYAKSAIAFNFAARILRYGWNVLYIALESDVEDTMTRIAAVATGTGLSQITRGNHYDFQTEQRAHELLIDLPGTLFVNREPLYRAEDIEQVVRTMKVTHKLDVFIVDHMQLATSGDEKELAMMAGGVSRMMAVVAREERMLSIGLAQLKTIHAKERKHPPSRFDVMGGVPMVQDPDAMLMIDHSEASWKRHAASNTTEMDIAISKMRTGIEGGTFRARIEWETGSIVEVQRQGGHEVTEADSEQVDSGL